MSSAIRTLWCWPGLILSSLWADTLSAKLKLTIKMDLPNLHSKISYLIHCTGLNYNQTILYPEPKNLQACKHYLGNHQGIWRNFIGQTPSDQICIFIYFCLFVQKCVKNSEDESSWLLKMKVLLNILSWFCNFTFPPNQSSKFFHFTKVRSIS